MSLSEFLYRFLTGDKRPLKLANGQVLRDCGCNVNTSPRTSLNGNNLPRTNLSAISSIARTTALTPEAINNNGSDSDRLNPSQFETENRDFGVQVFDQLRNGLAGSLAERLRDEFGDRLGDIPTDRLTEIVNGSITSIPPSSMSENERRSARNAALGGLAFDYFRGRIKETERREVAFGLLREIIQRENIEATIKYTDAGPWEIIDAILNYLWKIGRATAFGPGIICTAGFIIYYRLNPPEPSCSVAQRDKWQHCYVGCKISFWCPAGVVWASVVGLLKEIWDEFVPGGTGFDEHDIAATIEGATTPCGFFQSCEDCCCDLYSYEK
ncbi:MAG: hypothetical protein NUW37_04325 [Planctomycetes bacterium]|nr:hypothetical protein [Planctomycetota bacterium]